MKLFGSILLGASFLFGSAAAAGHESAPYHEIYDTMAPNVTAVNYTDAYDGNFSLMGYVSIPEAAADARVPAVVIIPDNSDVDEYEQVRATMIAETFGWVGFAADIYGNDVDPDNARAESRKYRANNTLFTGRIQAAVDLVRQHPAVDPERVAIIGYCFGGTGVLTYSFLGGSGVVGAVSFHGGLTEFEVAGNISFPVLVLSGGADDAGTEVEFLEEQLNEANSTWQITRYSNIQHAWTKWNDRRYNALADHRSWREMETFLAEVFGELEYGTPQPEETEVTPVEYDDNGFSLTGYLAIPEGASMDEKLPAVVIVPDWDGVSGPDGYESHRATLLAEEGYIAFAADIYGSENTQVEDMAARSNLTNFYRTDYELFVSRIQAAVDVLANHELVDSNNILMIGYCFGGTGVVDYAFSGLQNVKAVVPYHGGLTSLAPIQTDAIYPYVLVQSGGEDDAHGNNTELEMALDGANATWEITRYSNVFHGFTSWEGRAYNELADWRSWDAMLEVFNMIIQEEEKATITELAIATSNLTTLVDLVVLAGLADTLAGDGPFTVFAPRNSAFAQLDTDLVDALTADPNGTLTDVLLYHVVPGTIMAADLVDGATVATVEGGEITVSLSSGAMINNANVVLADVMASNGVVHIIDAVLIPPAESDEDETEVLVERGNPDMP